VLGHCLFGLPFGPVVSFDGTLVYRRYFRLFLGIGNALSQLMFRDMRLVVSLRAGTGCL
jgi:hypothetical protein